MRLRDTPREPEEWAYRYTVGGRDVYLYPGDPFSHEARKASMLERVRAAAPEGAGEARIAVAATAALVREQWADPVVAFAEAVDPDALATMEGPELWAAAESCRAELFAVGAARLGIDRRRLCLAAECAGLGVTQEMLDAHEASGEGDAPGGE